jgi:thiamine biosynthesis lipoprotein
LQQRTNAFGGLAFGGTWRVSGGEDLHEQELRAPIEAILATIDRDMSPWRADSTVSRFNTNPQTGSHRASQDLCTVVGESLTISRLTEGAFDPTIGPAVARFGYGPITEGGGSIADLELGNGQIGKADPRLTLDLCGIAKGYALDRIIALLRARGVTNALVELGGEIAALGTHPDGRPWQVAIESPQAGALSAQRIIAPGHLALATSGHSQNGYRGRIMLSHLIDPASHRPADNGLAAVSVLAPTAMRADALATALSVMGPHRGPASPKTRALPRSS